MMTLLNSQQEGGERVETAARWQSFHGHVGLSQSRVWSWPCPEEERIVSLEHQPTSKDTTLKCTVLYSTIPIGIQVIEVPGKKVVCFRLEIGNLLPIF